MNRFELFNAMVNRETVKLNFNGKQYAGKILAIELEDGSGLCFNVKLSTGVWVFVRSIGGQSK
jgi:hypothetical protein